MCLFVKVWCGLVHGGLCAKHPRPLNLSLGFGHSQGLRADLRLSYTRSSLLSLFVLDLALDLFLSLSVCLNLCSQVLMFV